ncbi:MAG TPA: hypothetical protein VN763_02380, partial [Saprospiraceae bacterium]|nr:hypothetical protein [Saprospiraceae bacterium]
INLIGQRRPYLEGRGNIRTYDPLPHPQTFKMINGMYGEGPVITRLEGVGAGENFLELAEGEYDKILADTTFGKVVYRPGAGPVRIQVFNPLVVEDGEYILEFVDPTPLPNDSLSSSCGWILYNVDDPSTVYKSDKTLSQLNEQLMAELGISILIGQSDDAGDRKDATNGTIGFDLSYGDSGGKSWLTFIPDDYVGNPITNFIQTELPEYPNFLLDPDQAYSKFSPWVPFIMTDYSQDEPAENPAGWNITPGWMDASGGLIQSPQFGGDLQHLNNVDIILTSDTTKWSRCVVVETANIYFTGADHGVGLPSEGNKKSLQPRSRLSVSKHDTNLDGWPDPDGTVDANGFTTGMGWFPGFAVDVETGERLNIFFGENSVYDSVTGPSIGVGNIANDMIWNPGKQALRPGINPQQVEVPFDLFVGGYQFVYVTRTKYDACTVLRKDLDRTGLVKARALAGVTWCAIPLTINDPTIDLLPLNKGIIPNDVTIKLRVDNPYQKATGTGAFNDYPAYQFKLEGVTAQPLTEEQIPEALAEINVVPNPYLAYAEYETSSFDNVVKITNLPAHCTVTIYSLDGRFIRQYNRNEVGKPNSPPRANPPVAVNQIVPDLEWNLKNSAGIPVASGIYLIHVEAPGLGERVIKWFGVGRQFDPSGL